MTADSDDILDDLFHGCAFAAFVEQAVAQGGPPHQEATRLRANRYYEQALAERNRQRSARPQLTCGSDSPISSVNRTGANMPDTPNPAQTIQVGDTVNYRFSVGELASEATGKVIGLLNTRDGHTMADVEWDKLGPPKRLNVNSFAKV